MCFRIKHLLSPRSFLLVRDLIQKIEQMNLMGLIVERYRNE